PGVNLTGGYLRRTGDRIFDADKSTSLCVFTVAGLARKQHNRSDFVLGTSAPIVGWRTNAMHDRRGRYGHEFVFDAPTPMASKLMPMGSYGLIAAAKVSQQSSFVEVNGRARMYVESAASRGGDTMTIGGSHDAPGSYNGSIAELLIYDRALSNVELRQL